jgi:hypothetical protein
MDGIRELLPITYGRKIKFPIKCNYNGMDGAGPAMQDASQDASQDMTLLGDDQLERSQKRR